MCHSTFSTGRIVPALAGVALLGVLTACGESVGPAEPISPNMIIIIGGHPIVFNAQLRAVGNPDIKPLIAVVGHLQLTLYETEAGLVAGFRVAIANSECESAQTLGGGMYFIQDSEDFPSPLTQPLIPLPAPEDPLRCGGNVFEGAVGISGELVTRLIEDPDFFTAVFFLNGGGAIAGALHLAGPETAPTR